MHKAKVAVCSEIRTKHSTQSEENGDPDTSHSVSHTRPRPPCGSLPFHYLLCKRTHPYPIIASSNWLKLFSSQPLSRMDTPTILKFILYLPSCLWRWNRQNVPKRRHIKFRRRGITQKKTYNNV